MNSGVLEPSDRFAIVPESVIFGRYAAGTARAAGVPVPSGLEDSAELPLSGEAVKLYAILQRRTDKAGECWPTRRWLAEQMGFSRRESVDRALRELVLVGEVEVRPRLSEEGDRAANLYRLTYSARQGYRAGSTTLPAQEDDGYPPDATTVTASARQQRTKAIDRKPVNEKTPAASPAGRAERNEVWDALVAELGFSPATKTERSNFGRVVKELLAVGATGAEVRRRVANWRRHYPKASFTVNVLPKWWSAMDEEANGSIPRSWQAIARAIGAAP